MGKSRSATLAKNHVSCYPIRLSAELGDAGGMDLTPLCVENLLLLAQRVAKLRGVSLATISRLAHGDGPTFDRLVAGGKGSITTRKYQDAMRWLMDPANWPEGATIPDVREPWLALHAKRKAKKSAGRGGKTKRAGHRALGRTLRASDENRARAASRAKDDHPNHPADASAE